MVKSERLEDLGRLSEKLRAICNNEMFESCGSRHDFEQWKKANIPEDDQDLVHRRMRFLYLELLDCLSIAIGESDE